MADPIIAPQTLLPYYQQAAQTYGIPLPVLLAQGNIESGFNPQATGAAGEWGISQILPSTAASPGYGVAPISREDAYNPAKAIPWQAQYLAAKAKAQGVTDWSDPAQQHKGLAAYNGAGPNAAIYGQRVLADVPRVLGGPVTALGDSIAQGYGQANGLNTLAQVGASPSAVMDRINGLADGSLKGHTVFLSSGVSNNPQQIDMVPQQIQALQSKGVSDIRLYGVGSKIGSDANARLQQIAKDSGATFVPLGATGNDGVHPVNYRWGKGGGSVGAPAVAAGSVPTTSALQALLNPPPAEPMGVALPLPSMPSAPTINPLLQMALNNLSKTHQAIPVDYDPWKYVPKGLG